MKRGCRGIGKRRIAAALAFASLLSGCAAPTRHAPRVPLRTEAPLAGLPAATAGWPAAEWWKDFHDAQLDALVELATARAPALDVAAARYRQAAAGVDAARADSRPELTGLASASRAKIGSGKPNAAAANGGSTTGGAGGTSGNGSGAAASAGGGFTLPSYVTSVVALADFSYDFDWWGAHRAAIESAIDQEHAALAERSASLAALQYGVAAAYFDWLGIELRLTQAAHSTDVNARLVAIAQARVNRGIDSPQTLEAARAQLAAARTQGAQLEGAASLDLVQIAALCGVAPAELPPLSARALPTPDTRLPDDARVHLLARRPDIVASRWQVQAASRDVDQARAAFFPDVSLNALGAVLRSLPTPGPDSTLRAGSVGLSAMLPLFDGGRRQAAFDRGEAALDLAIAQYNQTVLDAAQDVNRQTVLLGALAKERQEHAAALAAAAAAYDQAQARARRGVDDPRQTLGALGQLIAQRDAAVSLDAQALATQVSLVHALGGGYRSDGGAEQPPATLDSTQEATR